MVAQTTSKESACNAGDPGSIPELERSPGGLHLTLLVTSTLLVAPPPGSGL